MSDNISYSEINKASTAELTERVRDAYAAIQQLNANALARAIEVGEVLIELQGRGVEVPWYIAPSTARLYMQLARHKAKIEAKLEENPTLSLREARRLIAKPKKPKPEAPLDSSLEPATGGAELLAEDDTSVPTRGWLDPSTLANASDREVTGNFVTLGFERFFECLPKGWGERIRERVDRRTIAWHRRAHPNTPLTLVCSNPEPPSTQH
jgi:hypothetical protein